MKTSEKMRVLEVVKSLLASINIPYYFYEREKRVIKVPRKVKENRVKTEERKVK